MKSNVTLTIIAACVLAACGSSSHKAPVAVSKPQPEAHGAKKESADKSQDLDGQNSSNEGSQPKQEAKQEPEQEPKQESKQEPKQESKQEPKQEPKQQPEQEPKQEPEQKPKQEPEQEPKQEPKQELPPELPKTDNSEPQAEARPSDQEVFSRLVPYAKGSLITDGFFKMIFNEGSKKIELDIIQPHHFTGQPQIETLRDIEGALVGYYGYARVAEQRLDDNREQYAVDHHYFMQYADPTLMKRPVGLENITYNGKMLYQYKAYPNKPSEADVEAVYSGMDKTLKMTITSREDGVWKLHQDRTPKSPAFVNVDERGNVAGNLMFLSNESTKVVPDGHFIGGLYGKNGSVLNGRAFSEQRDKEWQGVVGATAVAKPAP